MGFIQPVKVYVRTHVWSQVLELEIPILEIVRSLREGNFKWYGESVTALMPWMFALDHILTTQGGF